MSIATAIKSGSAVYFYDERGSRISCVSCSEYGLGSSVVGVTNSTVSVRDNNSGLTTVYDERGSVLFQVN